MHAVDDGSSRTEHGKHYFVPMPEFLSRAMCLFPAMHRFSIQDERARRLFDVAAATPGTAVFVHCGVLSVGVRKKLGLPSVEAQMNAPNGANGAEKQEKQEKPAAAPAVQTQAAAAGANRGPSVPAAKGR